MACLCVLVIGTMTHEAILMTNNLRKMGKFSLEWFYTLKTAGNHHLLVFC